MDDYSSIYRQTDHEMIQFLGQRFKDYRMALHLKQKDVAEQSGVSVMTIVRFERGEGYSLRLETFIRLIRAIELLQNMTEIIPYMPRSVYDEMKIKPRKRIR